jgi:ribosomal protein L17
LLYDLPFNVLIGDNMENTHFTKAQRMVEDMVISMAIQEAINQRALTTTPEQKKALDKMIAQMASTFKPAES